jgi:hypothetical protein
LHDFPDLSLVEEVPVVASHSAATHSTDTDPHTHPRPKTTHAAADSEADTGTAAVTTFPRNMR